MGVSCSLPLRASASSVFPLLPLRNKSRISTCFCRLICALPNADNQDVQRLKTDPARRNHRSSGPGVVFAVWPSWRLLLAAANEQAHSAEAGNEQQGEGRRFGNGSGRRERDIIELGYPNRIGGGEGQYRAGRTCWQTRRYVLDIIA